VLQKKAADRTRVSYWGLAGGLWATSAFAVTAVLTAFSDHDHQAILAVLYGVLALVFVPAIVFSMIDSPRRQAVLRAETGLCLILGIATLFVPPLDPGVSLLLTPATVLLATGAGIVFAANRSKKGSG